jgi:hypothetical protein
VLLLWLTFVSVLCVGPTFSDIQHATDQDIFFPDSPSTDVDEDAIEIAHAMLSKLTSADAKETLQPFQVFLFEIIGTSNPRAALFDATKQKEIQGLVVRGTWKVVMKEEMPENPNIMGGRFVLMAKDSGTRKEIYNI